MMSQSNEVPKYKTVSDRALAVSGSINTFTALYGAMLAVQSAKEIFAGLDKTKAPGRINLDFVASSGASWVKNVLFGFGGSFLFFDSAARAVVRFQELKDRQSGATKQLPSASGTSSSVAADLPPPPAVPAQANPRHRS